MSQLAGYGPYVAPMGRWPAAQPAYASAVPQPQERSRPSILAFASAAYLCSVPLLSSWSGDVSWVPQVIGLGVGISWLLFGVVLERRRTVWALPVVLYLAWLFWATSGLMVTLSREYFMTYYLGGLKVAGVTWVLSQCVRNRADLLTCMTLLGLASLVVFATGADTIARGASFSGMRETADARAGGILIGNANDLGTFGVIVLIGNLMALWGYRSKFLKVLGVATAPAALYIIAASGSRMAMIGVLIIGIGVYFFHLRKMGAGGVERKVAMLIMGMVLAAGAVYYVVTSPFFFRLQAAFADANAVQEQARFQYFLRGMGATLSHPILGLGIGGFSLHGLGGRGNILHYSHSTVTEVFCATGFPGGLLYGLALFALFNIVRKLRKAPLPKHEMATVNLIMVAFWTVTIMSVVSVMFMDRLLWPLFGAFCGYLTYLRKRYPEPKRGMVLAR